MCRPTIWQGFRGKLNPARRAMIETMTVLWPVAWRTVCNNLWSSSLHLDLTIIIIQTLKCTNHSGIDVGPYIACKFTDSVRQEQYLWYIWSMGPTQDLGKINQFAPSFTNKFDMQDSWHHYVAFGVLSMMYKHCFTQTRHNFVGEIRIFSVKICINPYPSFMHRCA